ncbi:hypothetical protein [Prochlorococcus sp. MIT 1307]|uniref:hypothetical protein n=1 Tax=Prochlorococcus sp. MIT 1307 TaxID=3096219 RepID=UPI002A75F01E|nr:hypothetical protein [Prochlorococcus sp. MIT 1307]
MILLISLIAGTSTGIANTNDSHQKSKIVSQHSLPIKETFTVSAPPPEVLLPMPIGEVELASQKVKSSRNPFEKPSTLESTNLDILNSSIQFNGIAQSGNSLVAMIKTPKGHQTYAVGDPLGNGLTITSISSTDITVDLSDGYRNYRLSLKSLKE